jgi:cell shape-determining protein MreC
MKSKIQQLEEEIHEQCVLNGKGAEREADLLGKVERLERENKRLRTALAFISSTLSEDSDMSQAECMEKSYDYAYAALYPKNGS